MGFSCHALAMGLQTVCNAFAKNYAVSGCQEGISYFLQTFSSDVPFAFAGDWWDTFHFTGTNHFPHALNGHIGHAPARQYLHGFWD